MKLLLDTHIWLWMLLEPERLSKKVTAALVAADNELWLSSISVWEFLMLVEKGRIAIDDEPRLWLHNAMTRAPVREAPITRDVAVESRFLKLSHADPADRFIAATAKVFDLVLVTADDRLVKAKDFRHLRNR